MDFSQYINAVEKELGIDLLPEGERQQVVTEIGEAIMQRCLVVMYERLTEPQRTEFEKIGPDDVEGGMQFLQANIPDFENLVPETAREVLAEIRG